jgi:hypothetical protein
MNQTSAAEPAPVIAATDAYERWMRRQIDVVEPDLDYKHQQMRSSLFAFLRGTFYRWAALWPITCPELVRAPQVLAVGDLHVENFGTWRDNEGRLIWGVNDFDEVARMPYAVDLVRTVASAIIAKGENALAIDDDAAATAVLDGYAQWLEKGGEPFVLEESHPALRDMALDAERDPVRFWSKLTALPEAVPTKRPQRLLKRGLPAGAENIVFAARIAGEGSLGRPRYVAIAACNGGYAAREAKAWLPSAWGWAAGKPKDRPYAVRLLKQAVRQPDPYYAVEKGWVVRRLGPHCSRIELAQFPKTRDEREILKAMGQETANLHLGTPGQSAKVYRDLTERKAGWLLAAAQAMVKATEQDWQAYRAGSKGA